MDRAVYFVNNIIIHLPVIMNYLLDSTIYPLNWAQVFSCHIILTFFGEGQMRQVVCLHMLTFSLDIQVCILNQEILYW